MTNAAEAMMAQRKTRIAILALLLPLAALADDGGSWQPRAYVKASNTGAGDAFAACVAISGSTMVVGAPHEDGGLEALAGNPGDNSAADAGAAYVYVKSISGWTFQAYLKAANTGAGDNFGAAVDIDGDSIVVGAPNEDGASTIVNGDATSEAAANSGAAYVFVRSGSTWTQQAYLKATDTQTGDHFGMSVGISGDRVVAGAPYEDTRGDMSGSAYAFRRSAGAWTAYAQPLRASNGVGGDKFALSVAIDGTTIIGGSPWQDGVIQYSGAAYVFEESGDTWVQKAYLKADAPGNFDQLGCGIAIQGDRAVISAHFDSDGAANGSGSAADDPTFRTGAVYVFVRSNGAWTQEAKLRAAVGDSMDGFGSPVALPGEFVKIGPSVGISGDTIVVGAAQEDSASAGDPENDTAVQSGAAYVFQRIDGSWVQTVYLKAPLIEASDLFGSAVAVDGGTVAIGSSGEDGASTGIGGDPQDNSAAGSGAVHVYRRPVIPAQPGSPSQTTADGSPVPVGAATHASFIACGPVSSSDEDPAAIQVEIKPVGVPFDGQGLRTGDEVASGATAMVVVDDLPAGSYRWRLRSADVDGSSAWVEFGDNGAAADIVFTNAAPAAASASQIRETDGSEMRPGQVAFDSVPVWFRATGIDPDGDDYVLEVEVKELGRPFDDVATLTSGTVGSGEETAVPWVLTAGAYRWQYRTVDVLGAASAWTGFGGNPDAAADLQIGAWGSVGGKGCQQSAAGAGGLGLLLGLIVLVLRR